MLEHIYYTPANAVPVAAIRLTVGTVTLRHLGVLARQQREIAAAFADSLGIDPNDPEAGRRTLTPEQEQAAREMQWQQSACRLIASTVKVEIVGKEKDIDHASHPAEWPWKPATLADLGWDTPDKFLDAPVDLVDAWQDKAAEVNPGVWGPKLAARPGQKKPTTGVLQVP